MKPAPEVDVGVENARLAGESIQSIKEGSVTVVNAVEEITEAVREQAPQALRFPSVSSRSRR